MTAATTVSWLAKAIGQATMSARFYVSGTLPVSTPGLEVAGLGAVEFPLKRGVGKKLSAQCQVAPYGQGTETLVDRKVRNTFELNPEKFQLSPEWNAAVARIAQEAGGQLGLPAERVEARLYRLLVYEKGGFFLSHRDSEKADGMVASLIVVLPNPFEGGTLIVKHGTAKQTLKFEQAAKGQAAEFAAFYADCEHEVQRVSYGIRVCLTYNLVLKPAPDSPAGTGKRAAPSDGLVDAIQGWGVIQRGRPLVFALEHHYTERGLALDLLKGADRQLADLVIPAAEAADYLVHLAQVSRHLLQFADDGSFERSYYRRHQPRRQLEIGETFEDELKGEQWTDLDGKKQPWGEIPLEMSGIISAQPLDQWKPTSEHYQGYTGNEGNTLDRWYHRSALVLWPRASHFDVVARCGPAVTIPLLRALVGKLAKTSKKRLEEARTECSRLARGIIAQWPRASSRHGFLAQREPLPLEEFPDLLLTLHDRDTIALFLAKMAEVDQTRPLAGLVVAACREFGWHAFAGELRGLLTAPPDASTRPYLQQREFLPLRDVEWLAAFCLDTTANPDRTALARELCALAVERFCAPVPPPPAWYRPEPSPSEKALPLLLKALVATDLDEELDRVLHRVEDSPQDFSLDSCQVPALQTLVPWARENFGTVHPYLLSWLASIQNRLEAATTTPPAPPQDWTRPANVDCNCQYCAQLKTFLANPTQEVGRIAAAEAIRHHLTTTIAQHACDVKHTLERRGSPYALVLTKTTGSFERAVQRYEADRRLLEILEQVRAEVKARKGRK